MRLMNGCGVFMSCNGRRACIGRSPSCSGPFKCLLHAGRNFRCHATFTRCSSPPRLLRSAPGTLEMVIVGTVSGRLGGATGGPKSSHCQHVYRRVSLGGGPTARPVVWRSSSSCEAAGTRILQAPAGLQAVGQTVLLYLLQRACGSSRQRARGRVVGALIQRHVETRAAVESSGILTVVRCSLSLSFLPRGWAVQIERRSPNAASD